MQQFDICRLRPARDRTRDRTRSVTLILVLQADLMDDLDTRVVAPMAPVDDFAAIGRLRPEFEVAGKRYRLITDRISVLSRKEIGAVVVSARNREWDIRRALDQVFVGV